MARRARQVRLGDELRKILKRMDSTEGLQRAAVVSVWDEVVGSRVASHTRVLGVRNRELLVAMDSPAWANELSFMSETLKERLNQETGENLVDTIRFTVSKEVAQDQAGAAKNKQAERRYGGEKVTPKTLTETELAAVERSVASIPNEGLREAALRATIRDLEWKKGQETSKTLQEPPGDS